MFAKFFSKRAVQNRPLDKIIERASLFLGPQIKTMEEFEGNKFAFITYESVFYMIAVAEELGKRTIMQDERDEFFSSLLGDEYRPRINHLFDSVKARGFDVDEFTEMVRKINEIARSDVKKGVFFCSNFLVENARGASLWQKGMKEIEY